MRAAHVDDVVSVVVLVDDLEISAASLAKGSAAGASTHAAKSVANAASGGFANHVVALEAAFGYLNWADVGFRVVEFVGEGDGIGHFWLQPLIPRRGLGDFLQFHYTQCVQ